MILRTEAKLVLREPIGIGFSLVLPLVLLLVFGLPDSAREPDPNLDGKVPIDTVMPSMALALSFGMLAIFMLPGFMTDYRARGILRRLSTTPVHPAKLLGAQLIVQAAIARRLAPARARARRRAGDGRCRSDPRRSPLALVVGGAALFSLGLLVAALAPDPRARLGRQRGDLLPVAVLRGRLAAEGADAGLARRGSATSRRSAASAPPCRTRGPARRWTR